jgi:hypothetical protein
MFSDADHEVIDSPEALFRHLFEEHGVEEAADLDPETAPVQFWIRRHAELERAERSARRQPPPPPEPEPFAEPRPESRREEPRPDARGRGEAPFQPPPRSQPAPGAREGRRHAGFGDPLLEAMTRTLVGRGHDEAAVRSAIRSFPAGGGQPGGEAGVRAAFVEPMLRSVADHLLAPGGPRRPPARSQPPPAAASDPTPPPRRPAADRPPPPAPPKAREDPARPEAVWAGLWADLAEPSRRAGEGAGAVGDDGDDLMAVANAVQARRRVRLLRR